MLTETLTRESRSDGQPLRRTPRHRKLANKLLVKWQSRWRPLRAPGFPYWLVIEITNACDGTCVLCPVGQGYHSRKIGQIKFDDFVRVVDMFEPYAMYVGLHNWGEPLLHPDLVPIIHHLTERGIRSYMSSNLHFFRPEHAEQFVGAGLWRLSVSLHGISSETYQKYQPGKDFEAVLRGIRQVVETKRKLRRRNPEVNMIFVVNRYNEHELPHVPAFAAGLGIGYKILDCSLNLRFMSRTKDLNSVILEGADLQEAIRRRMAEWLPSNGAHVTEYYRRLRLLGNTHKLPTRPLYRCSSPWSEMIVSWDGDVSICCGAFSAEHSMGNLFRQSLEEVWNGPQYMLARATVRGAATAAVHPLCGQCPGLLL